MDAYVDFDFYSDTYHGDAVPEDSFSRIALKATAKIDELTRNNADPTDATNGEKVKLAVCEICDILNAAETGVGRLPTSESGAGYTASYPLATLDMRCREAAGVWLRGTGLLFAGV